MNSLRTFSMLRLLALACFLGSLAVAIASPFVHPQSFQVVCSGSGAMLIQIQTDDGTVEVGQVGMDCPLCSTPFAPPTLVVRTPAPASPLAYALLPTIAAHIAAITAAPPLPARGPPTLS